MNKQENQTAGNESLTLLGRSLARELTVAELAEVAGGASGGIGNTYSGSFLPDDQCPTDEF